MSLCLEEEKYPRYAFQKVDEEEKKG